MPTFWKPAETRKTRKARADRAHDSARSRAREAAYRHFSGCCARCGRPLKLLPSEARHEFEIAHGHEEPPRSLGGDPTNAKHIVILCAWCHGDITNKRIRIEILDPDRTLGTWGDLAFVPFHPVDLISDEQHNGT